MPLTKQITRKSTGGNAPREQLATKVWSRSMSPPRLAMHFNIGSQIPSTLLVSDGVGEANQIYRELSKLGASMRVIDVGGGRGIDYDGSQSGSTDMSVGYSLDEYACAVVGAVMYACDRKHVRPPTSSSESERALVSQHSVLIFEAVSSNTAVEPFSTIDPNFSYFLGELADDARSDYNNLMDAAYRGDSETCAMYADQLKRRCIDSFKDGIFGPEHLATVFSDPVQTYHMNLSIFTSMPDFWAIGQLFPIVPIHHLNERPGVKGVLSVLTSDGKVDRFIGGQSIYDINLSVFNTMPDFWGISQLFPSVPNERPGVKGSDGQSIYDVNLSVFHNTPDFFGIKQLFPSVPNERPEVEGVLSDLTSDRDSKVDRFIGGQSSLPLHEPGGGNRYYRGRFHGGAYQEAPGGLHNLFPGLSVVRVAQADRPHCFAVTLAVPGSSCADALRAIQNEPEVKFEALKHRAEELPCPTEDALPSPLAHSMPYLLFATAAGDAGGGDIAARSDNEVTDAMIGYSEVKVEEYEEH